MGILDNWLRTNYRAGDPINHLCVAEERNIINRFISELQGVGCVVQKNRDGRNCKIIINGQSDTQPDTGYLPPWGSTGRYTKLFDLIDLDTTSYSIDSRGSRNSVGGDPYDPAAVYLLGAKKDSVSDGTGFTFGALKWTSTPDPIVDDTQQAVFLEINRKTSAVYLIAAAEFPDGTAEKYAWTEVVPLWWIPWDSGDSVIDSANIVDMRHAARLPGMA